jgi:hypothetical protein
MFKVDISKMSPEEKVKYKSAYKSEMENRFPFLKLTVDFNKDDYSDSEDIKKPLVKYYFSDKNNVVLYNVFSYKPTNTSFQVAHLNLVLIKVKGKWLVYKIKN